VPTLCHSRGGAPGRRGTYEACGWKKNCDVSNVHVAPTNTLLRPGAPLADAICDVLAMAQSNVPRLSIAPSNVGMTHVYFVVAYGTGTRHMRRTALHAPPKKARNTVEQADPR
jgi:hypothetical protein